MFLTYSNKILSEMRISLNDKNLAEASMADHISFILPSFSLQTLGLIIVNLKNSVKPDTTQKLGITFKCVS